MRSKKLLLMISLLVLLGMAGGLAFFLTRQQPTLYIAVVGPMSGPQMHEGEHIVKSINLYLEQVNAAGGIAGKAVKLLVFDHRNDVEQARAQAQAITRHPQILAVIGHKLRSTSLAAGEVYQQAGVPVITATATSDRVTQGNVWSF